MKKIAIVIGLATVGLMVLDGVASPTRTAKFRKKMRELSTVFANLYPKTVSNYEFAKPSSQKSVSMDILKLKGLVHGIKDEMKHAKTESDPMIASIAGDFENTLERVHMAYQFGEYEYARAGVRTVMANCIACHTRKGGDPKAQPMFVELPKIEDKLTRAHVRLATRNFKQAMQLYRSVVGDQKYLKQKPISWREALKMGLLIQVRVLKSPKGTTSWIDFASSQKGVPNFIERDLKAWRKQARNWAREKGGSEKGEVSLFRRLKALMNQVRSQPAGPFGDNLSVMYLRATSLAHEFINKFPASKRASQVYLWAGMAYSEIQEFDHWLAHEEYFKSCIQKAPHSFHSKDCYRRLEESVMIGFSGSSGTHVPESVSKELKSLKKLAF